MITILVSLVINIIVNLKNTNIKLIAWNGKDMTYIYPLLTLFFFIIFLYHVIKKLETIKFNGTIPIYKPIQLITSFIQYSLLVLYSTANIKLYVIPFFYLKDTFTLLPGINITITPNTELKNLKLKELLNLKEMEKYKDAINNEQLQQIVNISNSFKELENNLHQRITEYELLCKKLIEIKPESKSIYEYAINILINEYTLVFGLILLYGILLHAGGRYVDSLNPPITRSDYQSMTIDQIIQTLPHSSIPSGYFLSGNPIVTTNQILQSLAKLTPYQYEALKIWLKYDPLKKSRLIDLL